MVTWALTSLRAVWATDGALCKQRTKVAWLSRTDHHVMAPPIILHLHGFNAVVHDMYANLSQVKNA